MPNRRVTDQEREHILQLAADGHSCQQIARETGRSADTVSRIAKAAGHKFGHTNLARAHQARRSYGAEARAQKLEMLHERQVRILERMAEPARRYEFGGKDNDLNWVDLDEPDSDMLRQYSSAFASLSRAEMDIVKYDERGQDGSSDVDEWLDWLTARPKG